MIYSGGMSRDKSDGVGRFFFDSQEAVDRALSHNVHSVEGHLLEVEKVEMFPTDIKYSVESLKNNNSDNTSKI